MAFSRQSGTHIGFDYLIENTIIFVRSTRTLQKSTKLAK
jgi:hypothetical protein